MSEWMNHVKATMRANPGTPLRDVLKIAKGTYKKGTATVKKTVTPAVAAVTSVARGPAKRHRTKKHRRKSHKKHRGTKKRRGTKKHHSKHHRKDKGHRHHTKKRGHKRRCCPRNCRPCH